MSSDDALAFCRRRLETAVERSGDLDHVTGLLRDDDREAEQLWTDTRGREVRQRDLEPHRAASDRQRATIRSALEAGRTLLASLEEARRHEADVVRRIAAARALVQTSAGIATDARRHLDSARMLTRDAERATADVRQALAGL